MSRILVPVDFSPSSLKALAQVKNLMNKEIDSLLLLHVYGLPIPDPELPYELLSEFNSSLQEIADMRLEKLKSETQKSWGSEVQIETKSLPGHPVQVILEQAESYKADLLIMGMRGKNKALRQIFGTTSSRVIKMSSCPVIVVPEEAKIGRIRKIAYASNLEEEDIMALDKVIKLANGLGAEVHCVHVQQEGEQIDIYKKELLEKAYRHDLTASPIKVDVVKHEQVLDGLSSYIEETEIDLIVMLSHKKSLLNRILKGSYTWDLTFQSRIPVWVFHAEVYEGLLVEK